MILMSACNNVKAYAVVQVFYTVGSFGLQYALSVFIADASILRKRRLIQAIYHFVESDHLLVGWPDIRLGRRWAPGMFTILIPAITLPLYGLLLKNFLKAKKLGLVHKRKSNHNFEQSASRYYREFNAVSLGLIPAGVALFFLPFNLYTLQAHGLS
ncbi:hypothetical protein CC78DRAFT_597067 [Lojkania enalia]|uniref:Uncharacterized protein n=1 Tax=Lojkania enalia TaxID=147567 RepID=A0A9P4JWX2_9PLEO|nr:hypothetical protein CC78DRAFT_597067 [Didymosphaeria enalia]